MSNPLTDELLQELLQSIAPDMDILQEARKRRDKVLKAAMKFDGAYKKILSGSAAHGTVIFKVSDADGAVVIDQKKYPLLTPDGDGDGPKDIVTAMADFIRPILQEEDPDVWVRTARKRSILVDFRQEVKDEQNPTADLIVAFNRKDKPGIWIPNLKTNTWDASDPEQHTAMVQEAHEQTDGVSTRAIRLGKLYAKQWDPELLCSFNVTALVLECIEEEDSLSSALLTLLKHAATAINQGNTPDPAGVSGNIKLPEKYTRQEIVDRLNTAVTNMESAINEDATLEKVTEALGKLFWHHKDLVEEAAKKVVEESMKSGSLGIKSGAFVSAGVAARSIIPTTAYGATATKRTRPWGKSGPWFTNQRERLQFERGLINSGYSVLFAGKKGSRSKSEYHYIVNIPVEPYGNYIVRVVFAGRNPGVFADSLEEPRHAYGDGSLCMWYPGDPKQNQWNSDDGLLRLLDLTKAHIFKELRFKETGKWIGKERHYNEPTGSKR